MRRGRRAPVARSAGAEHRAAARGGRADLDSL